jgi:hypothetical protein
VKDLLLDNHLSPDCLAGKHKACRGDAWCFEDDRPAECLCACHADYDAATA